MGMGGGAEFLFFCLVFVLALAKSFVIFLCTGFCLTHVQMIKCLFIFYNDSVLGQNLGCLTVLALPQFKV